MVAAGLLGVLVVLAVRSDGTTARATPWSTAADVAVGLVFVVSAALARGAPALRTAIGLVGVAWLAASVLPAAQALHQAVLMVALAAFPTGRPRGTDGWAAVLAAVPVAVGVVPQLGVAALFGAVALVWAVHRPADAVAAYPLAASAAVAAVLAGAWVSSRLWPGAFDPRVALAGYELVSARSPPASPSPPGRSSDTGGGWPTGSSPTRGSPG